MAAEDRPGGNPFAAPEERREPVRRLRGRLTAPVTIWTSWLDEEPVGLTVSSILVAEGEPGRVAGLIGDKTDLFDAIAATRSFVVHVVDGGHRRWAETFAGVFPAPGGPFAGLDFSRSDAGPLIDALTTRATCSAAEHSEMGYHRLITATIEDVSPADMTDPLVFFRGRYRALDEGRTTTGEA